MNENQPSHESLVEQTLKRFRSPESTERAARKRKFSAGIFIVNIILIMALYVFISDKKPADDYRSSSFNYKNLQFRFSLARERETRDYIFTLTTRIAEGKETTARFNNGIAELVIKYGPEIIVRKQLGRNSAVLSLKPGETDIQKQVIDQLELKLFANSHPEHIVSQRRSLLQSGNSYIPLQAEVLIHTDQPVSTSLNFRYEVDR